ncbi:polysaccharide deacetylase family protein [Ureibacillus thermosphaericus]|uniref:polysaccharide deacetylase family protein n=1 Tax=Ureibacillus thermosphaericus TaxID=51173 RepID=UPI000BBBAF01|nr:polysaccharide deacetylase family protein [Ureibacillus thermosphaericus]
MRQRKSKRRAWIDLILIGSIIALTTIIVITISITGQFKFQKPTVSATTKYPEIPSLIDETDSKFPEIRIVSESSMNSLIPYSIDYPKTPFDLVNEQITKYIKDSKRDYITSLNEKNHVNKVKTIGDLDISTEIHLFNNQFYSIVLKKRLSLNRVSYKETYKTIVFNKETGELIDSSTLLNKDIGHLGLLAEFIQAELKEYYGKEIIDEKLVQTTVPNWNNFNRFAITSESVIFYFNQGELAEEHAGPATINIPIYYLNPILASAFQSEVKSNVTIVTPKTDRKKVALTFDDGPHPQVTMQILNTLEKYGAKATFFMLGKQVENHKNIVHEVLNRGHEIGNHTYNHPVLTKQSTSQVSWQVDYTSQVIYDVIGEYPTLFRPPYGATNSYVESLIDVPVILWTIDTYDWKYRDSNKLLPIIKANLHDGAIILMHDIHQSTADGLESVLAYLQQEGYECVTVSEILNIH